MSRRNRFSRRELGFNPDEEPARDDDASIYASSPDSSSAVLPLASLVAIALFAHFYFGEK